MRLSSPTRSESAPTLPVPRRKHRRRTIPTPSATTSRDLQNQSSPSYSPPSSLSPSAGALADDDDEPDAISQSQPASYSDSRSSFYPAQSAYVNVAPLPVFRGEASECPVAHLARFDRVCRANNATTVDTIVRIFPVTLDGDAALWYDLSVEPCSPPMPWHDIRAAFLRVFTPPDFADRSRAELMGLNQRDGESVNGYHLRLQWVLRKWPEHGFPDALLKGIFVDGLKDDYQDWILPQRPATLAEAVRLAVSWEQARNVREARRGEVKCGFCGGGGHEEGVCEVRRRMKDLWLRSKVGATAPPALSPSTSLVRREGGGAGEDGEGGIARAGSMRRAGQCQCWKHQCWKKFERSNSNGDRAAADGNTISNAD